MLAHLPRALKGLPDLERGVMRVLHGTTAPAELCGTLRAIAGMGPALCGGGGGSRGGTGASRSSTDGVASPLLQRLLQAVTSDEVGRLPRHCSSFWLLGFQASLRGPRLLVDSLCCR